MKKCSKCHRMLFYHNFTRSSNIKDGFENTCKKCRNAARKKHQIECQNCSKIFKSAKKNAKFCSTACVGEKRRKRIVVLCSYCKRDTEVPESKIQFHKHLYCNQDCRTEHLKVLIKGKNNPNFNRISYKCDGCFKKIKVIPSRIKKQKYIFCSNECYKNNIGKYLKGKSNPNYNHKKYTCSKCGDKFIRKQSANKGKRVFCSRECYFSSLSEAEIKAKVSINCPICNKEVKVWKSRLNYSARVFCSRECANIGNSKFYSGKNSPSWNPDLTEEERILCRKYEAYYQWRKKVFDRDGFRCTCCGNEKGGNLVAHHIMNYSEYPELRTVVSNGITMCESCHKDFHNTYGYTNNNEVQLNKFLNKRKKLLSL